MGSHCKLTLLLTQIKSNVGFQGERKIGVSWGKTSQSRVENQQIQPMYDVKSGSLTQATFWEESGLNTALQTYPSFCTMK